MAPAQPIHMPRTMLAFLRCLSQWFVVHSQSLSLTKSLVFSLWVDQLVLHSLCVMLTRMSTSVLESMEKPKLEQVDKLLRPQVFQVPKAFRRLNSDISFLIPASLVPALLTLPEMLDIGLSLIRTKVSHRSFLLSRSPETFHRLKLSSKRLLLKLVHVASALVGQLNLSRTLRTWTESTLTLRSLMPWATRSKLKSIVRCLCAWSSPHLVQDMDLVSQYGALLLLMVAGSLSVTVTSTSAWLSKLTALLYVTVVVLLTSLLLLHVYVLSLRCSLNSSGYLYRVM